MQSTGSEIPNKRYFKIGEVGAITGVEPYVLRYWETEFPSIKPVRAPTGQRLYRKRDVEAVLKIKYLLYEKGFTIVGARKELEATAKIHKKSSAKASFEEIKSDILSLKKILS
jgi:DNA-binding transcriptional MerR regulator